jgi:phage gp36-like protein
MANRPAYADDASVQTYLRNVRLPAGVTLESLSVAASNELDGHLGSRYVTPIAASFEEATQVVTANWLQNVTAMLAAGTFYMSMSGSASHDSNHQYGEYLRRSAFGMINQVISGKTDLQGIEETSTNTSVIQGATVLNQDAFSQVDLFYDNYEPEGFLPGRKPREANVPWPREAGTPWLL